MNFLIKKIIVIFMFLFSVVCLEANATEKLAIISVNMPSKGSSYNIYPNSIDLISERISNNLYKYSFLTVIDPDLVINIVKSSNFSDKYNTLLMQYKDNYSINQDICTLLGKKIGADKLLFVSGGFDVQNLFLKENPLYKFNVPETISVKPIYRYNTVLALVDSQTGLIIWDKTYKKDFKMQNFAMPSSYFAENVIPIDDIKSFSSKVAANASFTIATILKNSAAKNIEAKLILNDSNLNSKPKEGVMTTDGHFSSADEDKYLNSRKERYLNWLKNLFN